jgi:putative ABC transport system permease protein
MFKQTLAVTAINLKSIPQRPGMSAATVLSIALVVGVLLGFLAMANGFRATVQGTGADDVAVVMRAGSMAELNSNLMREDERLISEAPGIARDADGEPVTSAELYVIVDGVRRASQTTANLPLRGVGPRAPELRDGFEPGAAELLVGENVLAEYEGFALGEPIRLGSNTWTVVGIFSTGGTVFDSELWTDAPVVQSLYQRGNSFQSVRARLASPAAIEEVTAYTDAEPRLNVDVQSERAFFASQAGGTVTLIEWVGWPLAILMAIGALAGAWNTMYSSVDARVREIATLRALGFSGFSAFLGTMVESLLLALLGGVIGAVVTWLLFDGLTASTLGSGFTQIVFAFAVTPGAMIAGVFLALAVGLLGGLIPAMRAARVPLLSVHGG